MIFILTKQRISGFCPEYVIVLRTPQKHLISLDCNIHCTPFLSPYHQEDRNFFFVRSFAVKHCRYYCKHRPYYCYQKPNHHLHSFYFFFQALPPQKCFDFGPTTFYKHLQTFYTLSKYSFSLWHKTNLSQFLCFTRL